MRGRGRGGGEGIHQLQRAILSLCLPSNRIDGGVLGLVVRQTCFDVWCGWHTISKHLCCHAWFGALDLFILRCALVCSVRSFVWMNTRVFLVCDIVMLGHCK